VRSTSSTSESWSPLATRSATATPAEPMVGKTATIVAAPSGSGVSRTRTLVTIPSVPSLPISSWVRSSPATPLIVRRPVSNTVPSASTTSSPARGRG
jgi:hypothetical protein